MTEFFDYTRSVHLLRLAPDGTIQSCNGAVARNLDVPMDHIVGRSIRDFIAAADVPRLSAELQRPGRHREPLLVNFGAANRLVYTLECWLDVDAAGATLIAEPLLQVDQRVQRHLMQVMDDLALLSRERSKLVESERGARLDAEAANRQKDRAIATIAHELRQPLVPMNFALALLTANASPEVRDRAFRTIERQVTQFTRLVEDLLDAARIRENKLELDRTDVDLTDMLRDLVEGFSATASSSDIDFAAHLPAGAIGLRADAARLTQVFSNLFDNAVKYTGRGGRITLTLSLDDGTATVSVRDTGRGIAPDVLPRIFEMFAQQGEGERGGLGIGLAVASGIIGMHGGRIEARSEGTGRGSEFVVRLPASG